MQPNRGFIVLIAFFATFVAVNSQRECTLPDRTPGRCILLTECQPLFELFQNKDRTPEESNFLWNSHCGRKNRQPKVCCELPDQPLSDECTTPDGDAGICKGLFNCSNLNAFFNLPKPLPKEIIAYLKRSSCPGTELFSVCCSDKTPSVAPTTTTTTTAEPVGSDDSVRDLLPSRSTCGKNPDSDRIVGGEVAGIDEYPWMILIEYFGNRGLSLSCGGSLISERYVLTAAHCVEGNIVTLAGTPTNIRLGEFDKSNDGPDCVKVSIDGQQDCTDGTISIPIQKIITHPNYEMTSGPKNDISLIRMEKPAPISDFIVPVCLPESDITDGQASHAFDVIVAGWGTTETGRSSDKKLYVQVPFIDLQSCQVAYQKTFKANLWDKQICAGADRGRDTCRGDSGGPLMRKFNKDQFELTGIVSFGPKPCGIEDIPGVYTKVFAYTDWILRNMEP